MSRKLVTIRKISEINPIEGADLIKVATVDGWKVVVKADEFSVGDYACYFEIDSFLNPEDVRFKFLLKGSGTKRMGEKEGIRLRTVKLRGQVSQGLLLPLYLFPEIEQALSEAGHDVVKATTERLDFSEVLGVEKYEPPETGGGAVPLGTFPWWCERTDEERIQNNFETLQQKYRDVEFTPTLKLDGSSTTIAYVSNPDYFIGKEVDHLEDQIIVCSRTLALKHDPEAIWWKGLENDNIPENLREWCVRSNRQIAIQGELVGPGIQGSKEKFRKFKVFAFRAWDIDSQKFLSLEELNEICNEIGMSTTVQYEPMKVFSVFKNVDEVLTYAEGPSINHGNREGIVFTANVAGERISFKAISNKFLLKDK